MTVSGEIYFCRHCGNTVRILSEGEGVLMCCGTKMIKLYAQFPNQNDQIHQIKYDLNKNKNEIKISIGSPLHPMQEDHFITWIEITWEHFVYQKSFDLLNDITPIILIYASENPKSIQFICNQHGLFKN